MATRSIVSYADLTLPYDHPDETTPSNTTSAAQMRPTKKRRKGNHHQPTAVQAESRLLSHEEIWDDSALIEAWDAAMEEYEAFNGDEKSWKLEPVKKSRLWYNTPPDGQEESIAATLSEGPTMDPPDTSPSSNNNSQPLNFDTFIPTHDPSLELPHPTSTTGSRTVDQDEAFSSALDAMYWVGYWTAMYYSQRQQSQVTHNLMEETTAEQENYDEDDLEAEKEKEECPSEDDDLLPTQR